MKEPLEQAAVSNWVPGRSARREAEGPRTWSIAVLPGDGIGREVMDEAIRVLAAASSRMPDLSLAFHEHSVGAAEFMRSGDPLPEAALAACRSADAILLGAMGLPNVRWPDGRELTPQIDLREQLDLYAGIRPLKLYHAQDCPLKRYGAGDLDLVIVRENCEGLFSGRLNRFDLSHSEARDTLLVTRHGAERICRVAFDLARKRRRQCTLVDKANVLPSMVYFRSIFEEVACQYPDVRQQSVYVDAMALYLVQKPDAFDVLVTENMFGDILSDLGAGLVGGMGVAPSADIGPEHAVFQPSHGTAPDIAGKGIANPLAMILSAAMMLEWLGTAAAVCGAGLIYRAVERVLAEPAHRTPDMGGKCSTRQMGDLVVEQLREDSCA